VLKAKAARAIRRVEPQFLHVAVAQVLERVDLRTAQRWPDAFQQPRPGRQCRVHLAGQLNEFNLERFMENDDQSHQQRGTCCYHRLMPRSVGTKQHPGRYHRMSTDPKDTSTPATPSNAQKDPDDWTTGDESMTGAQASYLRTLCDEAGEPFDERLTKAEASKMIDVMQRRTGRGRTH
jgi:hypothetical protein